MVQENEERGVRLRNLAQAYGIELTEEQAVILLRHVDLVLEKNRVVNLTSITDPDAALVLHVLDSLLLIPALKRKGFASAARLLDIGTGAGFPGIPLAVTCGMRTSMVDSVGKKVAAVQEFIDALGIPNATVEKGRAETFALAHPHEFDFVTARAVAPLGVLIEYAAPLLVRQGQLVVSKALVKEDEWNVATAAADICGLELVSRETLSLPDDYGPREIITYQRVRKPKIKLPRANGAARRKPLGT